MSIIVTRPEDCNKIHVQCTCINFYSSFFCLYTACIQRKLQKCIQHFFKNNFQVIVRGGEWYLEKSGSRKIWAGSRNLGSVFDKSRSLIFTWFVFTFFESRNFLPKSLGLGFLTRISVSRRVLDFTIRHPYCLQQLLVCKAEHKQTTLYFTLAFRTT